MESKTISRQHRNADSNGALRRRWRRAAANPSSLSRGRQYEIAGSGATTSVQYQEQPGCESQSNSPRSEQEVATPSQVSSQLQPSCSAQLDEPFIELQLHELPWQFLLTLDQKQPC